MKIIETNIPDIQKEFIDERKIIVANKILQIITPLIKNVSKKKKDEIIKVKQDFENKQTLTSIEKESIVSIYESYEQEKEKLVLLNKIETLIGKGASKDPSMRNELIVMLKTISNISKESIIRYKKQVDKYLTSRF